MDEGLASLYDLFIDELRKVVGEYKVKAGPHRIGIKVLLDFDGNYSVLPSHYFEFKDGTSRYDLNKVFLSEAEALEYIRDNLIIASKDQSAATLIAVDHYNN